MTRLKLDENFTVEDISLADVKIQKIYLDRTRVYMVAQAAIYMFFLYILVGMVGLIKGFFSVPEFLLMLTMGLFVLFIATHPYMKSLREEYDFLNLLEQKIKKKGKAHRKVKISRRHLSSK